MKKFILTLTLSFCVFSIQFGQIQTGAEQTKKYFPFLENKNIALVVNQTSTIGAIHLVDSLINSNFKIKKVFAPEHGFRGTADAGEHVKNHIDTKTGLPIISLYGNNKKPTKEQMAGIDLVIFDIQDVGVRFYTYISTMHYVMEICAEEHIPFLVLDRPNPNGNYIAGPVLQLKFQSFVGLHPIPIVHGLTVGELAKMINKEKWLKNEKSCDLTIIKCENYDHNSQYTIPIKPSPNLPNDLSISLYPSLCLFEPTEVSIGRGTYFPFQVAGTPQGEQVGNFTFTPKSIEGMSKHPKHENKLCYGIDFRENTSSRFNLEALILFYQNSKDKSKFFTSTSFFNQLVGNNELIEKIKKGDSYEKIEKSWNAQLKEYLILRSKYLLYPDFN